MAEPYPHTAGHRGNRDTSIMASKDLQPHLGRLQATVFNVVAGAGHDGATCDNIADALGWIVFRVRPRTAELRALGKIVDSGKRRKGGSGRLAIVWCLPDYLFGVAS